MGGNLADIACVGSLEEVEGQADPSWRAAQYSRCAPRGGIHAQRNSARFLAVTRFLMRASTSSSDVTDTVVLSRFIQGLCSGLLGNWRLSCSMLEIAQKMPQLPVEARGEESYDD
jgi:hypothetical protein